MQEWKTISKKTILDHSKYLRVEEHEVELPDGKVIPDWPWLITPDFVNVAVVTDEGKFLVFRQTKYAVKGITLATVGGYLEPGEEPLPAAKRELLEETGYEADEWIDLGHYVTAGNRGAGHGHFYLAKGARKVGEIDSDDLEEQEMLLLSRPEVESALDACEFKVLSWAAIMSLALRHV